jgi:MFS family permease
MGISEAFYIPAALALIADFHTGSTRSRAVGFHQIGIYIGVIVGGFSRLCGGRAVARLALGLRCLRAWWA